MQLYPNKYYHLYNRSINKEPVFRSHENYVYFLRKYRKYLDEYIDTIAYCLMPTHFHFFVFVKGNGPIESGSKKDTVTQSDYVETRMEQLKKNIGVLLSSYAKAINKRYNRKGSLFQQHTNAIEIDDLSYFLWIVAYIHQNPVRAGIVQRIENWEYSSYKDYIGERNGTLPKKDIILNYYDSSDEFKKYSEEAIKEVQSRYWV